MSLITYLTRIHFADRILEEALPEEIRTRAIRRPMIVTDAAGARPEVRDRLEDALPAGLEIRSHETGPAPARTVDAEALGDAVALHECDAVIAMGGPEALDLARCLGRAPTRRNPLTLVAIPTTTAGIGLGPVASDLVRAGGGRPRTPTVILCDPTLTAWADAASTAEAGMDALTHCIEAYLGSAFNPPADGIAIEGARRALAFLERAVSDGRDIEARREILAAALNAGLAFEKGAGGLHAVARALEREAGLSGRYGVCHAALLPHVLGFNAPAVAEKFGPLGQAMGMRPGTDLPSALAEFGVRLGLPRRLSALGLGPAALRRAARTAAEDPASGTNPRHVTEDDYLGMLEAAL